MKYLSFVRPGTVYLPLLKDGDSFGFRIEAPFRHAFTEDLIVRGAVSYVGLTSGVGSSGYFDSEELGVTAIYRVSSRFWAAVELGLQVTNFAFERAAVPVGIAAGIEVIPGIAVLPGVRLYDIGSLSGRTVQVLAVYQWEHSASISAPESQVN